MFSPPDARDLTISSMSFSQTPKAGVRASAPLLESLGQIKMSQFAYEDVHSNANLGGEHHERFYSPMASSEEFMMHMRNIDMNRTSNYRLVPPLDLYPAGSKSPDRRRFQASPTRRFHLNPVPLLRTEQLSAPNGLPTWKHGR